MTVQSDSATSPLAKSLSEYIASAADRSLPGAVAEKTRHHVLDTLAAMISGSRLKAGKRAAGYVARFAGTPEATVIDPGRTTSSRSRGRSAAPRSPPDG